MNRIAQHASDDQLQYLVFGDEQSDRFAQVSDHVESCVECRSRLETLTGTPTFDLETRNLLSDADEDTLEFAVERKPSPNDFSSYLNPASHPELLGRMGRYDIERVIGAGGMGVVFKALPQNLWVDFTRVSVAFERRVEQAGPTQDESIVKSILSSTCNVVVQKHGVFPASAEL